MCYKKHISIYELQDLLNYDPVLGVLTWRDRRSSDFPDDRSYKSWSTRFSGARAGTVKKDGYRAICLKAKNKIITIREHTVAFAIHHDRWPEGQIDHINGVRHDNRIDNIRDVSAQTNGKNRKIGRNNKTKVMGVSWNKDKEQWRSCIRHDGNLIYLGDFDQFTDAVSARLRAETKYKCHKNNGRLT